MRKTLAFSIGLVFCVSFLTADIYIKQKTHTDEFSMMGQKTPASDTMNDFWIEKNKMAMLNDTMSFIIDLDKKVAIMISHESKTYVEMAFPIVISEYLPAQMAQMIGDVTATVTPTGETQNVNKWKCNGYDVITSMDMMGMEMKTAMKVWASTDVPFDWKMFAEKMLQMLNPMMPMGQEAINEFVKIKGWFIRTESTTNMMGTEMKSTMEVIDITKEAAPPGIYSPPEGYKKMDKLSMQDIKK